MKIFKKDQLEGTAYKYIVKELNLLKTIRHANIVTLEKFVVSKTGAKISKMIFELCNGGDLLRALTIQKSFEENEIKFIFAEITLGLGYLHENGIIHRDIKPANILLTGNGHVKIADVGLAKKCTKSTSPSGTLYYLAPEIINKTTYRNLKHFENDENGTCTHFVLR